MCGYPGRSIRFKGVFRCTEPQRMTHSISFPLQKLENVPLIQVEIAIENARDDDLTALANDREIASLWATSTTCSAR